eukprot:4752783-Alexandrium_andersonii.AAC.1
MEQRRNNRTVQEPAGNCFLRVLAVSCKSCSLMQFPAVSCAPLRGGYRLSRPPPKKRLLHAPKTLVG